MLVQGQGRDRSNALGFLAQLPLRNESSLSTLLEVSMPATKRWWLALWLEFLWHPLPGHGIVSQWHWQMCRTLLETLSTSRNGLSFECSFLRRMGNREEPDLCFSMILITFPILRDFELDGRGQQSTNMVVM